MWRNVFFLILITLVPIKCTLNVIKINTKDVTHGFNHFWKSTGFCPPDPKDKIHNYLLSKEAKVNYALIGSLPNRGIEEIRIHWLLNTLQIDSSNKSYDYQYLDDFLELLVRNHLAPNFELMGKPIMKEFSEQKLKQSLFWQNLVEMIVSRYLEKYGLDELLRWKFETWNEPDLKTYNILNFTLSEYLGYVSGCAEGLRSALGGRAVLGGPAGLFRDKGHPLCWGLLDLCNGLGRFQEHQCPIQFISFHRKGNATAEGVLNGTLELLDALHNRFPRLLARMPISNDEADLIVTWSNSYEWLADVRYAAMIVKVIADHYKAVTIVRKIKIHRISNDNAFSNYHPFYFTQRTLFARFQMNHSRPVHSQLIKKPAYTLMALLSFLGDGFLTVEPSADDPLLTVWATRERHERRHQSAVAVLVAYGNNSDVDDALVRPVGVVIRNVAVRSRYAVYLLDNSVSSPYKLWKSMGEPVFPDFAQRRALRSVEEPFRVHSPRDGIVETKTLNISFNLRIPSVALIYICSKARRAPLGRVTELGILNITRNEVLLSWADDQINTKCIRTYEVEFEAKCENTRQFHRINEKDTIFLSYHYSTMPAPLTDSDRECEPTIGRYRVRALDYWDRPTRYSNTITYS